MKILITKTNGEPMKSKVHAIALIQSKGLTEDALIEENGLFYYEGENDEQSTPTPTLPEGEGDNQPTPTPSPSPEEKGAGEIPKDDVVGQVCPTDTGETTDVGLKAQPTLGEGEGESPECERVPVMAGVVKKEVIPDWNTPVIYDGDKHTQFEFRENLNIPVTLLAKHPKGQTAVRPYNAFEVMIDNQKFIISEEICKKLFKVKEV